MTPVVEWQGCYDAGWKGLITSKAFSHPAKMARGLVARIFDELLAMGALKAGDLCVDPFSGIGSTGIEAASRGVRFVGVELELTFVALAQENFALHRRDWEAMGRPQPVVVRGDSRNLREVLGPVLAECVVSSPPWGENTEGGFRASKFKASADALKAGRGHGASDEARLRQLARDDQKTLGEAPGQLAAMPVRARVGNLPVGGLRSDETFWS